MGELKWILIAGGVAYLFFHDQIAALFGSALAPTSAAAPSSTSTSSTPAPAPAALDSASAKARLLAAAQNDANYIANKGTLSVYEWDFYYQLTRGTPGPDPAAIGFADGSQLVTVDEYWNAMTAHGLSGLRGQIRGRR